MQTILVSNFDLFIYFDNASVERICHNLPKLIHLVQSAAINKIRSIQLYKRLGRCYLPKGYLDKNIS
ncbi:hypothetical protein D3C85_1549150 [compost metagenome]